MARYYLQCPLEREALDGLVETLEHLAGEVLPVVEFRQVLDELGAGHLVADDLAVQVRVEQHDGTRQRVNGICSPHNYHLVLYSCFKFTIMKFFTVFDSQTILLCI